jgi:hypothetical protein
MSRLIRCRRCGVLLMPDRAGVLPWAWRLCPRCRGPLPPTGGVAVMDDAWSRPCPVEGAT